MRTRDRRSCDFWTYLHSAVIWQTSELSLLYAVSFVSQDLRLRRRVPAEPGAPGFGIWAQTLYARIGTTGYVYVRLGKLYLISAYVISALRRRLGVETQLYDSCNQGARVNFTSSEVGYATYKAPARGAGEAGAGPQYITGWAVKIPPFWQKFTYGGAAKIPPK